MAEKTFNLHFGSGIVAEEAQASDEYKVSTIQLLSLPRGLQAGAMQSGFVITRTGGRFSDRRLFSMSPQFRICVEQ